MFHNFISLGRGCLVASSMSKYGLRSFSGPFDWLTTQDFGWVLHYIETNFFDFLQQENLAPYPYHNNEKEFIDRSSGFVFPHEGEDYRCEFDSLKEKYDRRIARFNLATRKKTCFLRTIAKQEDLEYVLRHAEYIQNVISKNNAENEIVFLAMKEIIIPKDMPFKTFHMPENYGGTNGRIQLRSFFDGANDFLEFCGQSYSGSSMIKNLIFDEEAESKYALLVDKQDRRYLALTKCLSHHFEQNELPPRIIIYGAGNLGKALYLKIRNLTHVEWFIDHSKYGKEFQGIPIRSLNDLKNIQAPTIIVAKAYNFDAIKEDIYRECKTASVLLLNDFFELS